MPDNIPSHYTTQFSTNWTHRISQGKARLDAFVESEDFDGERKRYDRIGTMTAQERTERKAPTRIIDASTDSRWAVRKSYDIANLLDKDDEKNLGALVLPTSSYVMEHARAYNKKCDDVAIDTALGRVITGEMGDDHEDFPTSTNYVNTAGKLGAYSSGSSVGLTLGKLLTARELLDDADSDDDAPRVLVCTARQITDLLNTTEVKSADYNTVRALAQGHIDTFCGFKFVRIKRLPTTTENGGTARGCVAWVKGAVKLVKGAKKTLIDRRADLSQSIQIYSDWYLGGTRVHDEAVIRIGCTETA
jgi:hypothetical protein